MKNLTLLLVILGMGFIAQAQHTHEHLNCTITMDEIVQLHLDNHIPFVKVDKMINKTSEIIRQREFKVLFAYDKRIETMDNRSGTEVKQMIYESALKTSTGLENAQRTHPGFSIDIIDYQADYLVGAKFKDILTWLLLVTDGKLDSITDLKYRYDYDFIIFITAPDAIAGTNGIAILMPLDPVKFVYHFDFASGMVKWNSIKNKSVTTAHEIGHLFAMDHEDPYRADASPEYARAYIGETRATIMKGAANLDKQEIPIYSSKRSVIDGDTLGSELEDNVRAYDTLKQLYWKYNPRTYTDIEMDGCAHGTVYITETNGDTIRWSVVSGEVDLLSPLDGISMDYTAHKPSTILLTSKREGRRYADTTYIELPGLTEHILNPVDICTGQSYYFNGQDITETGSYDSLTCADIYIQEVIVHEPEVTEIDTVGIIGKEIIIDGISYTTDGTVTVNYTDTFGCESTIIYNLSFVVGIDELSDRDIIVYPNPVTDKLNIKVTDTKISEIIVYDILTRPVISTKFTDNTKSLDVSHLSPGIYYIKVFFGKHNANLKIRKQ